MPAPGAPGASSRGRGGKFKKYTRGGGHHFSRDLQPVDSDGNHISMWSKDGQNKIRRGAAAEDDDDDDEESSEEEDSNEEAGPSNAAGAASREDRKAQKKARKDAAIARQKAGAVEVGDMPSSDEDSDDDDDDMPANPNHSKAAREQTLAPKPADDVDEITDGVKKLQTPNRRERETLEAKAAKERYLKLQAQGKTDEAKADMARLKLIREQREAESARRQAEKEEKETQEKTRRAEMEAREAKRREAAAGPKKGKKK